MEQRLQKIMSEAGIASRRKSEELIEQGLVKVNGKTAKLGDKADPDKDKIEVKGKEIKREKKVYIIINKPKGILCSVSDDRGRKTVVQLIKTKEKIYPVGRLDLDTEGLLILTNDGDFANNIIHPRYNIKKTYTATLDKPLLLKDFQKLKQGLTIEDRKVNVFDLKQKNNQITLAIHEGRKHIIKKLFEKLGYKVEELKRTKIGNLALDLKPGEYKEVNKDWLEKQILPGAVK
ncbi:rRNA pseudouridine synthase [Candidatus Woesearchaeota archaeon]|nr:rRNA pseudouridine synthase [Candidatus Woesearchaeota archaeon]